MFHFELVNDDWIFQILCVKFSRSRSNTNQSHKSEVPENPSRKNCCLNLGRTTLEISLLVSIIVNLIFFWYTIWNLLKPAECAKAEGVE